MSRYYDEDGNAIPLREWIPRLDDDRWQLVDEVGDARVSTVYLGLDHQYGDGPPLIFETMVFGGRHDQYQDRYPTKEDAIEGHRRAVALVEMDP